jgi:hypothetical protein
MARKLRIQYPGAIYHIMSRGDRREPIFKDDADRERFLAKLTVMGKTNEYGVLRADTHNRERDCFPFEPVSSFWQ